MKELNEAKDGCDCINPLLKDSGNKDGLCVCHDGGEGTGVPVLTDGESPNTESCVCPDPHMTYTLSGGCQCTAGSSY